MFGLDISFDVLIKESIEFTKAVAAMVATGKGISLRASEFMYERAMYHCPVKSGYLKSTIGMQETGDGQGYTVTVEAPYAAYVEHGHFNSREVFIPPNPFLRTAIEETAQRFPSIARSFAGFKHEKTVSSAKNPNMSGPRIHTVANKERKKILLRSGEAEFSGASRPLGVEIRRQNRS